MYTHLIIVGSDYSFGKRIGFHTTYAEGSRDSARIRKAMNPLISALDNRSISVAIHQIQTQERTWESVIKVDPFFDGISLEASSFSFLHRLSSDKGLNAIDIAYLILSVVKSSPLKLQKLLYLCYADYLAKYGKRMFEEDIIAYKLGPVVEEVYQEFKGQRDVVEVEDDIFLNFDSDLSEVEEISMMLARVTCSTDGFEIYESCLQTIQKYGKYTASQLVDITHKQGGPWGLTYDTNERGCRISDETILQYHNVES